MSVKGLGEQLAREDFDTQFNLVVSTVHEFKSPLVLIQGLVSMLLEEDLGKINQEQRQAIERINISCHRLLRLIDGLLNVGRWRSKQPQLSNEPIALPNLLASVLDELQPIIVKRNVLIKRSFKKVVPAVLGDWQLVYQIMFNLIDNALKYSPPRSTIKIGLLQKGAFLQVKISDQGVGIKPKELGYLFERFSTTSSKPQELHSASSGLGLFIVKNLAELHGGFVSVKPLSRGTCFSVGLPTTNQLSLLGQEV
jgi:signal transduction histidine kinase